MLLDPTLGLFGFIFFKTQSQKSVNAHTTKIAFLIIRHNMWERAVFLKYVPALVNTMLYGQRRKRDVKVRNVSHSVLKVCTDNTGSKPLALAL